MAAPRSVVLNQDILIIIHDNLLVVVRDNDSDRAFLLLGDRLRLDAGLDLALEEVADELADVLLGNLLVLRVGELLVRLGVLDREGGPLANLKVEVAGVLAKGLGVDGSDVDLALVRRGHGSQLVGKLLAL